MSKHRFHRSQQVNGDRFCDMKELEVRLCRSRSDIYKQARVDPSFLELVRNGGKTGALNSKVEAFLASLPKLHAENRPPAGAVRAGSVERD